MTDRTTLKIATPCTEKFEQMRGDGYRRFCDACNKHVHNLSELTRDEAIRLIKDNTDAGMCVVYKFDRSGQVRFREPRPPARRPRPDASQLAGLKRLLAAAALVPVLATLPACDTAPDEIAAIEQPCDAPSADVRPIDLIMEAEARFVRELRDFLGEPDIDYEVVAGGLEVDPSFYEQPDGPEQWRAPLADPDPTVQPPIDEPFEDMIMGDLAIAPEDLERLENSAVVY